MSKYPSDLLTLIAYLKKLPGIGTKTAERFAFQLLTWPQGQLQNFSEHLATIKEKIKSCPECGCLTDSLTCSFCDKERRDCTSLCIIASAKDVYAFEETRTFRGLYHVIGGLLSPLDDRSIECLQLPQLKKRLENLPIKEVILALDSTLEGDATALYLKEHLSTLGLSVSRLAFGLPMGSSLDYIDGSTLARALSGRQNF
jgi:recombination protein RecR